MKYSNPVLVPGHRPDLYENRPDGRPDDGPDDASSSGLAGNAEGRSTDTTLRSTIADATRPTALARPLTVTLEDTATVAAKGRSEFADAPGSSTETVHLHRGEVWGGDFELGPLIGRGGMGAVYAGRQHSLDRQVAIKALKGNLSEDPELIARFEQEAKSLARINSPNVVHVYVFGRHRNHHFLVMELVEGEDLARKLKGGWRPGPRLVVNLMLQAARGLAAAGEHGIVHRDIKPGNLMLTSKGVLKVMDFGLARLVHAAHSTTSTGIILGTDAYMSPEQCSGRSCDQRSDLYSLGVVFYELLTGRKPFTGETHMEVFCQHLERKPTPPRELDPAIPPGVEAVVLACMEKDPATRYQSATELIEDLQRLEADGAPLARAVARPRSRAPGAVLAIVCVAALIGVTWLLWPRSRVDTTRVFSPVARSPSTTDTADTPESAHPNPSTPPEPAKYSASVPPISAGASPEQVERIRERRELWTARLEQLEAKHAAVTPARLMCRAWAAFVGDLPAGAELDDLRERGEQRRRALAWADPARAPAPVWAKRADCDDFGPWIEAQCAGYMQRFRYCPPGVFTMGHAVEAPGYHDDAALHTVRLTHGSWIANSETTVAQWQAVMGGASDPSTLPVTGVTWDEARDFCQRLGDGLGTTVRLPSEAEWEYACRAGHELDTDALADHAWTQRNAAALMPVRQGKAANAWGIFDMHGNALEWCFDAWAPYAFVAGSESVDPRADAPSSGDRVCRGGAFDMAPELCRAAARSHSPPISRLENLGMRVLIPE